MHPAGERRAERRGRAEVVVVFKVAPPIPAAAVQWAEACTGEFILYPLAGPA